MQGSVSVHPEGGGVEKILILRLDAIGDFILMSAAIRELRANYPAAHITLVVNRRVYPLAEFCPYVNEVIPFDTPFASSVNNQNLLDIIKNSFEFARKNFWSKHYDLSFTTLWDATHIFMSYISGARERIGYTLRAERNDLGGVFFNRPVLNNANIVHWCLKNLYLLEASGLKVNRKDIEIWYSAEDFYTAENLLKDFAPGRIKVAVGIGANVPERKYPVEKYLEAFKQIIDKGASLVILGGSAEVDDAKFLQDNLPREFVKNIAGMKLNWRVTAAVIAQTNLYIGNDTGTVHCAAALKIPVIVLSRDSKDFAAKNPACEHKVFFPYQTEAIALLCEHPLEGCEKSGCWAGKAHCITQINPEEIVKAFDEMIYFKMFSRITKIS